MAAASLADLVFVQNNNVRALYTSGGFKGGGLPPSYRPDASKNIKILTHLITHRTRPPRQHGSASVDQVASVANKLLTV